MTNAFLLTGEEKYRDWVVEYTGAWHQRARDNGGLLPDQVGHSGKVGEYLDGKWYGGPMGWTFPHGFLTMQFAVLDAVANALLITGDYGWLDLARVQQERILDMGEMREIRRGEMSVSERWVEQFDALEPGQKTLLVPYRYGDAGWFDWQPMLSVYPATLWYLVDGGAGLAQRRAGARGGRPRLELGVRLPQQGGLRPRAALAALPGRREPRLPGAHAARHPPDRHPPQRPGARKTRTSAPGSTSTSGSGATRCRRRR